MKSFKYIFVFVSLAIFTSIAIAGTKISPEAVPGAKTIDTSSAKSLFDEGVAFVDVRKDADWDAGRIPGAIHIELKKQLSEDTLGSEVKKNEKLVVYCNGHKCLRSSKAAAKAVSWGYQDVYYYRDGFPAWEAAGYPVE